MNRKTRHDSADHLPWSVTLRFGSVLLGCVLLAMSAGATLTPQIAKLCYLFGLNGIAFYFCLELAADYRTKHWMDANSRFAEQRLAHRLHAENRVAQINAYLQAEENSTGKIESAIDSQADLAVYLGRPSQPTLSV
ncbi:MAG: hypothetical protein ACKV2Q_25695 [Planctomycetaceae bacterium]